MKIVLGCALALACFMVVNADILDSIDGLLNLDCRDATSDLDYCASRIKSNPYQSKFGSGSAIGAVADAALAAAGIDLAGFSLSNGLVGLFDKVAGEAAEAIRTDPSGIIANKAGCSEAVGNIICHLSMGLLQCGADKRLLCKPACEAFQQTCLIDTAAPLIADQAETFCASAGLPPNICSLINVGLVPLTAQINICDGLPSVDCEDLGITDQLVPSSASPEGPNTIIFVVLALCGVAVVLGGALWYRQRQQAAAYAASEKGSSRFDSGSFAGGASTGSGYTQASGRTRSQGSRASKNSGRTGRSSSGTRNSRASSGRSGGARSGRSSSGHSRASSGGRSKSRTSGGTRTSRVSQGTRASSSGGRSKSRSSNGSRGF